MGFFCLFVCLFFWIVRSLFLIDIDLKIEVSWKLINQDGSEVARD